LNGKKQNGCQTIGKPEDASGFRMTTAIQKPELKSPGNRMFPVFGCLVFGSPLVLGNGADLKKSFPTSSKPGDSTVDGKRLEFAKATNVSCKLAEVVGKSSP
jgi:hypothetical protein